MRGRTIPLSKPRRMVCDLLHFARQVPSVPVQRRMAIGELVAAREQAAPRPSWCAVFTKAFAAVAAATPELRRSYLKWPRPRLFEHPVSVASIAVERRRGDENAVFLAPIKEPDRLSLEALTDRL